jgi:hypothetical protein
MGVVRSYTQPHLPALPVWLAREPPHAPAAALHVRVVALQVEFERQILKPGFQLIGYRLWV